MAEAPQYGVHGACRSGLHRLPHGGDGYGVAGNGDGLSVGGDGGELGSVPRSAACQRHGGGGALRDDRSIAGSDWFRQRGAVLPSCGIISGIDGVEDLY